MGHHDKIKKLGRTKPHRKAMLANMAMSLIQHRMIKTTDAKAKALRPVIDRLITTAKKDTLASKRQVAETVHVKDIFKKFFDEIVPQFADRDSGYTRIMKLGVRRGDGAPMSVVELMIEKPKVETDAKKKDKKDTKKAKKTKAAAK
jgi:large subunit ribosomal protein L17